MVRSRDRMRLGFHGEDTEACIAIKRVVVEQQGCDGERVGVRQSSALPDIVRHDTRDSGISGYSGQLREHW